MATPLLGGEEGEEIIPTCKQRDKKFGLAQVIVVCNVHMVEQSRRALHREVCEFLLQTQ